MTPQETLALALLDLLDDRRYRLTHTPSRPRVALANRRQPIEAAARELSRAISQEMEPLTPTERAALRTEMERALLAIFGA